MSALIDLTGQRFGRLTVVERAENKWHKTAWRCSCDCGNMVVANGSHLLSGRVQSCGCLRKELARTSASKRNFSHGGTGTRLYRIWCGAKNRCYDKNNPCFCDYGGRGITVCDEWLHDFVVFRDWAMSHGYRDTLSLDRIDNNSGYRPDNCRWATWEEQASNKRTGKELSRYKVILKLDATGKIIGGGCCGAETLADLCGLSVERIRELTREGVLEAAETPDGARYDLVSSVRKLIKA